MIPMTLIGLACGRCRLPAVVVTDWTSLRRGLVLLQRRRLVCLSCGESAVIEAGVPRLAPSWRPGATSWVWPR